MRWIWVLWLLLIAASFAGLEGYALAHDTTTLSRLVWEVSQAWPPLPFFVGLIVGFLACHFWWQRNPKEDDRERSNLAERSLSSHRRWGLSSRPRQDLD